MLTCFILLICGTTGEAATHYASLKLKNDFTILLSDAIAEELALIGTDGVVSTRTSNEITFLFVDSAKVNAIRLALTKKAGLVLNDPAVCVIEIPIGNLTGLPLLSGIGPSVKVKTFPVGSAVAGIESELISAGINQTKHRIRLVLHATVSLMFPFNGCTEDIVCDVIISETIIAGKVPQVILREQPSLS